MNKKQLDMLERAFEAEVTAALRSGLGIIQTRSKVAEQLADAGMLKRVKHEDKRMSGWPAVVVEGYELTNAGRMAYCASDRCSDEGAA